MALTSSSVFAVPEERSGTCFEADQPWEELALAVCDYKQRCGFVSEDPGRQDCQVWYFYFPVRWREGPLRNDDCYNVPDYARCQAENCLNGLTCEHFDECDAACFDAHCAFPEEP